MAEISKECGLYPMCKFPKKGCYLAGQVKNQADQGFRSIDREAITREEREEMYTQFILRTEEKKSRCADLEYLQQVIDSAEPNFD